MAKILADIEDVNLIEELHNIAALQPPRVVITEKKNYFLSLTDEKFVSRFRLSKDSVTFILNEIQLPKVHDNRGCSVPSQLRLLITLRWMATGGLQLLVADNFEVSQQFVSKCVQETVLSLARNFNRYVQFPSRQTMQTISSEFQDIARFPSVMGAIDCTHILVANVQKNSGVGKVFFSLNIQAVCGPNLEFYNVVCRWPGSVHDSRIFNNSDLSRMLEQGQYAGHLLGDSAYPLRPYLLTPITNPTRDCEIRYNVAHAKTRNTIERAFGVWKRRFRILSAKLRTKLSISMMAICSAAVLHNIAIKQRDVNPHNDIVVEELNQENDNVAEGNMNMSRAEELRKRAAIINTVFS